MGETDRLVITVWLEFTSGESELELVSVELVILNDVSGAEETGTDETERLPDDVGNPLGVMIVMIVVLSDAVGKPEADRVERLMLGVREGKLEGGLVEMVMLDVGTGKPDVGRKEMLELLDGSGKTQVGREVMFQLLVGIGNPELGGKVRLVFRVGMERNPELGRVNEVRLDDGNGGKPEVRLVTGGGVAVKFSGRVGDRLGVEKDDVFQVGAIVGRVPLGLKLERVSDRLLLGTGPLLMIDPMVIGTVTVGAVTEMLLKDVLVNGMLGNDVLAVSEGMGNTETVVEIMLGIGGPPCRVRS
ncbi:MAG: hypothetical protein Q9220_000526 [cf. Caloplaca sp. 1 TL-2023]